MARNATRIVRRRHADAVNSATLEACAQLLLDAVPFLADLLVAARPGHVYREALVAFERPLLVHILKLTGGNQLRAARLLGMDRATLHKRCRDFALRSSEFRCDPVRRAG
jgi:DNA-binding protein Fis